MLSFREHFINAGSFFVLRLVSLGLFFVTTPFFIRQAGSEAYGKLTLLLILFNFVGYLDLGTGYTLHLRYTRALARNHNPGYRHRLLSRAASFYYFMFFAAVIPGLSLAAAVSAWLFGNADYTAHLRWVALALGFSLLDSFLSGILRAHNRIYQNNLALFLFDLFRNAALFLGALTGGDLFLLITVIGAGSFARLLYTLYWAIKIEGGAHWLWPSIRFRDFWLNFSFGLPMLGTGALGILIHNIDKILVGKYIHLSGLGYYAIAADVNTKAWFLVFAISSSLYTVLVRRKARNATVRPLIAVSLLGIASVALFYYLPLSLWAEPILSLWIDPQIANQAAPLVSLHAVVSVLYLCTAVFYDLLRSQGQGRRLFFIYCFCFLLLLGLFQILPEKAGLAGYVWCYIILYATMLALMLVALFWRWHPRTAPK